MSSPADSNADKGFDLKRRKALQDMAKHAAGATACGVLLAGFAQQSKVLPAAALRPPGALAESDFLSACVRCGLCVRACPYKTLKLAEIGDGPAIGTPYFIARDVPCEMCDDIPCVKACPTGALAKTLTQIDKAQHGHRRRWSVVRRASTCWGSGATFATACAR